MKTPGNPLALLSSKIICPKCKNSNWNIHLEHICPKCGFEYQKDKDVANGSKGTLGKYYDIYEIRKGGMGEVFICKFSGDEKNKVACKTFQKKLFFDKVSQDAFIREIINWMNLVGIPHIMPAFGMEYYDGRPFVIMPMIEHDTDGKNCLRDFISDGSLPAKKILKYAFQIATGMNLVQEKMPGFIHGDLKPENIFLWDDNIFISDFGLSRITSNLKEEFYLESTFTYQAPEHWTKANIQSPSSDIYSFGIILYEMITGNLPFFAKTKGDWKKAHLNLTPKIPSISKENTLIEKLFKLSFHCMQKKISNRPKTFGTILKQIMSINTSEGGILQLNIFFYISAWNKVFILLHKTIITNLIIALIKLKKENNAIEILESYPSDSFDADLWSLYGSALSLVNREEEAIRCFENALKHDISDVKRYMCLIEIGLSLKRLKRFDEAIKLYDELLLQIPENFLPQLVSNLATVYIESDKSSEAIELLRPFLVKHPYIAEGWANLGTAYSDEGQFDLAIKCFEKALDLAPELAQTRILLANVLMELGRMEDAIDSLELAYGQGYVSPGLYANLVQAYLHKKDFKLAKEFLEKIQSNFKDHNLSKIVASIYFKDTGNYEQALIEINSAISQDPYEPENYFAKSLIYYSKRNFEEETKCLKKVLEFDTKHGKAAANLTISLIKLNCIEEAKRFAKVAQNCGTLSPDIENKLGLSGNSKHQNEFSGQQIIDYIGHLMLYRLSLYKDNCPCHEHLSIINISTQVNMEEDISVSKIFKNIKEQLKEAENCFLPVMKIGIDFCMEGRFDFASKLWLEANRRWPFIPDFSFALGYIFKQMLQPDQADKFFKIALSKGLDLNDKKSLKVVSKSLPCCNKMKGGK